MKNMKRKYKLNKASGKYEIDRTMINKGHGTQPDFDRNEDIINDYIKDVPSLEMINRYQISWQRIDQIRKAYGVPQRRKKVSKDSETKKSQI